MLVPTWVGKRPGSIHVADVGGDANCQDAVNQGDQAAVPFVTPRLVHTAQDEVERDPKQQAQEGDHQRHCHRPFCGQGRRHNYQRVVLPAVTEATTLCSKVGGINTAEEHILLCGVAYSRNGRLFTLGTVLPFVRSPQSRLCLWHNGTLVSGPRSWWGEGAVASSAVTSCAGMCRGTSRRPDLSSDTEVGVTKAKANIEIP